MATRFFTAFAVAMMAMATMSANNTQRKETMCDADVLPVVTARTMSIEVIGTDNNKYVYKLDGNGRVENRISYKQCKWSGTWKPQAAYTVFYGENETILTYAEYNAESKIFNLNPIQKHFTANEYSELLRVLKTNEK